MTDNVRKIFDMLGVEPNEEFKINNVNLKNHIEYGETFVERYKPKKFMEER